MSAIGGDGHIRTCRHIMGLLKERLKCSSVAHVSLVLYDLGPRINRPLIGGISRTVIADYHLLHVVLHFAYPVTDSSLFIVCRKQSYYQIYYSTIGCRNLVRGLVVRVDCRSSVVSSDASCRS